MWRAQSWKEGTIRLKSQRDGKTVARVQFQTLRMSHFIQNNTKLIYNQIHVHIHKNRITQNITRKIFHIILSPNICFLMRNHPIVYISCLYFPFGYQFASRSLWSSYLQSFTSEPRIIPEPSRPPGILRLDFPPNSRQTEFAAPETFYQYQHFQAYVN